MVNFIKRYKERKAKEIEEQIALKKANEDAAKLRISKCKDFMLSKPCPINDNNNCFDECVHFCEGDIFYMSSFYGVKGGSGS
jgi:hypothetical protein